MREHMGLYRGKRLDNGEWVEGWLYKRLVHLNDCHMNVVVDAIEVYDGKSPLSIAYYTVDSDTVGECTGMKDKNGKLIFEGDIIKIPDDYDEYGMNAGEIYQIYFCCGGFRLKPKRSDARGYWFEDDNTFEVIGNIHDNPELLKGESDGV